MKDLEIDKFIDRSNRGLGMGRERMGSYCFESFNGYGVSFWDNKKGLGIDSCCRTL